MQKQPLPPEDDPLYGKSTLNDPLTPVKRPPRRPVRILGWVMLGCFFGLIVLALLLAAMRKAVWQPPVGCSLLALAALSAFLSCTALENRRRCRSHTRGTVVEIKRQVNFRAPDLYYPRVAYIVAGLTYHIWGKPEYHPAALHTEIDVYYDPEDPATAAYTIPKRTFAVITVTLTVALAVGGVIVLCL